MLRKPKVVKKREMDSFAVLSRIVSRAESVNLDGATGAEVQTKML